MLAISIVFFAVLCALLCALLGPFGHAIVGLGIGGFVAWAFTLRRYGYRTEFERGPFVVAVTAVFGILFLVAGLLEPFIEHRRN